MYTQGKQKLKRVNHTNLTRLSSFYSRSEPSSCTHLQNTQKKAHPTEHNKHPMPNLFLLPQAQIHDERFNREASPNFRSGRVGLQLNLTVRSKSGTGNGVIGDGGVRAAIIVAVVVALERVSSTSHWTRKAWAIDSLGNAIAGVVMVIVTHILCVCVRGRAWDYWE
ncbi:uncharacterized protein G2W53_006419 [Senna tora]|uniref:Uncharacterized protein n=1 Tax=Senna tora TaxID=362788 RepID=A0A834X3Y9_9FABA|nr:uncharacterized protein G2W53_006419 [Senna tora]